MPKFEIQIQYNADTPEEAQETYEELWEHCCDNFDVIGASMKLVQK